ncbi:MAG: hypothetical protein RL199_1620 [Pseudomonadota bacterium]|jgi:hypothetical protein
MSHPMTIHARPARPSADELRTRALGPEAFFEHVEYETARHARYLGGVAIVRLAPRHGRRGTEALQDAVETELRRTDVACRYPDGSHVVLLGQVDRRAAESIAQRLVEVAAEIDLGHGAPAAEFVIGVGASQGRRITAAELWAAADDELAVERGENESRAVTLLNA